MLPLQSPDGSTPHPPGGPPGPLSASETGENRQQKPKTLPCKYCSKRFRSVQPPPFHDGLLYLYNRYTRLYNFLCLYQEHLLTPETSLGASTGGSSMSRDTRGHTQRKSRSSASGTVVERHLVDGESCAPNPPSHNPLHLPAPPIIQCNCPCGRISPAPSQDASSYLPIVDTSVPPHPSLHPHSPSLGCRAPPHTLS